MESVTLSQGELLGAPCLFYEPLRARGIVHGFLGKPLDFSREHLPAAKKTLCAARGVQSLELVRQVHGDTIVEIPSQSAGDEPFATADGVIFALPQGVPRRLVGIRTADCIPLVIFGDQFGLLVHAGWRGVAAKIIERALDLISKHEPLKKCTALVGPCAGRNAYEVGAEVISAIGSDAVYTGNSKKFLLDLEATAARKLSARGIGTVVLSGKCTISDPLFHSYRREGKESGRNLTYVGIS